MAGTRHRLRPVVWLVAALLAICVAVPSAGPVDGAGLSKWTGGINLYRSGVFSTQQTWSWCTAATVQIVRNIVDHEKDHSTSGQRRYFDWMRKRDRYAIPVSAGVDPAGWTAGLRHFVDDRYRLVASNSFDSALRLAVKRLRATNLPVALAVSHGNHAWILTGFTATADPARTSRFTITSVRVTGPLWGRQSKNGYDMRPNTKLTPGQLKHYFTPWKYKPLPMIWDGKYVSIQPVPRKAPAPAVKAQVPAAKAAAPPASSSPSPVASPSPSPESSPSAEVSASPAPIAAVVPASAPPSPAPAAPGNPAQAESSLSVEPAAVAATLGLTAAIVLLAMILTTRRLRPRADRRR